jgi:para-aminobenzoate synthetase component 1
VWLTSFAPVTSPREAALRLAPCGGLAWLDGGLEHGRGGRFSFVAVEPCEVVEAAADAPHPLALLDRLTVPCNLDRPAALSPSEVPYWVGHVAYDAHPVTARTAAAGASSLRFVRYDAWYAFDHARQHAYLVGDDEAACERLRLRLTAAPLADDELVFVAGPVEVTARERHRAAVTDALALIREGEVYEINLARRYRAPFTGSALGLFLRMRERSAVPLGCYLDGGVHQIVGRSMEQFLRLDAGTRVLSTSPIKGTLARAGDDAGESVQLTRDPKERAEHAMVVDLMRNDLSRVCRIGSVQVAELMTVLPFAGLSHLVSTVRGVLRDDVTLRALFESTFPPGSVTGAPKERVLRAIAALEDVPRGVYTGAIGFVDRAGGCSFAVAIRTAVVHDGVVDYFAGGGIVADSDVERETAETELKAALFLRALADA